MYVLRVFGKYQEGDELYAREQGKLERRESRFHCESPFCVFSSGICIYLLLEVMVIYQILRNS